MFICPYVYSTGGGRTLTTEEQRRAGKSRAAQCREELSRVAPTRERRLARRARLARYVGRASEKDYDYGAAARDLGKLFLSAAGGPVFLTGGARGPRTSGCKPHI